MAAGIETLDLHLQPLDRGVDEARGDASGRIFAQHVSRLQRVSQFKPDAAVGDWAIERKTKPTLGMKPLRVEVIAGAEEIFQNVEKVPPNEVFQHELVVQGRTPTYRRTALRLAPETGHQRTQEQLLRQAHARVRRHFERAELHQTQPSGWTVGRKQFVDAELGAVSIAGDVDEKIAKQAIDQPRSRRLAFARRRHHRQRDLELVELVVPRLIDARGLAGRADEQAGEQVGQRGMPLPVQNQALEQVWSAQEGAVSRARSSQRNVIATARAHVATVDHKLVGAEPAETRFLVERVRKFDGLAPSRGGLDIDLDDAWIGRHLDDVQARVGRRLIAFRMDRHMELGGGRFNDCKELKIVFQPFEGRHEHAKPSIARLDRQRGTDWDPRSRRGRGRALSGGNIEQLGAGGGVFAAKGNDLCRRVWIRQLAARLHWVGRHEVRVIDRPQMRQSAERPTKNDRRNPRYQKQASPPRLPHLADPAG